MSSFHRKALTTTLIPLLLLAISGCIGESLPDEPPEYIKDVVAYREGPGIVVYFILADKYGQMTTANGNYTIEIIQGANTLYKKTQRIRKQSFVKAKAGMGPFEHEVIACYVGRIAYDQMDTYPTTDSLWGSGYVKVTFVTEDGRVLTEKESVFF